MLPDSLEPNEKGRDEHVLPFLFSLMFSDAMAGAAFKNFPVQTRNFSFVSQTLREAHPKHSAKNLGQFGSLDLNQSDFAVADNSAACLGGQLNLGVRR